MRVAGSGGALTDKGDLIAGRYRLLARLGSGGMGVVWRGWDERLHRTVAIKQLIAQSGLVGTEAEQASERAIREGRITARLQHPHAIPVYDVAEHEGQPCLIMQFLPSRSLHEVLSERGRLPVAEVAQLGSQVASALAAAHQAGIVHRDIKPGNVLIAEDGSAKITDFGISRTLGDMTLGSDATLAGTPAYLAPEVARGQKADLSSDVYSLGATLYTALEGQPPFGTDLNPMALLQRVAAGEIRPPRRSGPMTALLFRMLHPDPRMRPTMHHVENELAALAAASDSAGLVGVSPAGRPAATTRPGTQSATLRAAQARSRLASIPPSAPPARASAPLLPPTAPPPPSRRRAGRRAAWIAATVAVIVAAASALILVLSAHRGPGAATGIHAASSPPATARATTAPLSSTAPSSSQPSTPASATSSSTPATSSSTPSATPSTSTPPSTAGPAATAAVLERAITDYYALMPDHLVAGWTRLTRQYQVDHAQGFAGYTAFWAPISRVQLKDVSGQPPDTVAATIRYHYRNGDTIEEQTTFHLVYSGGEWKIADSTVSSSRNV
jgi:eukaryotic-like serine/threonine-protein kinase